MNRQQDESFIMNRQHEQTIQSTELYEQVRFRPNSDKQFVAFVDWMGCCCQDFEAEFLLQTAEYYRRKAGLCRDAIERQQMVTGE